MPEPKRPLKVFLCHASMDKPKVRELYRYLKKRGIQPWFDEEDLVGGQDWQVEIPKALATSDAIIICLTKNSVDKEGYIQKEIKFALDKALEMPEGRIFLIPVKFEECEVPFTLSRYQWVDLTVESGYAKMMKALKFRASQLERSTVEVSQKNVEEENFAREKKEREAAEKDAREKIEREEVEKARLQAEEEERQRIAKEKAEREAADKLAREKAEKETAEKARLETEELARQKTAKEKAEREAAERAERERKEKELRKKQTLETSEKTKRKTENKPIPEKPKAGGRTAYWFGGLIVLVLGIVLLFSLNNFSLTPQSTPVNTQSQAIVTLVQDTAKPKVTLNPESTFMPELLPTEITDAKDVEMALVPAGEFIMGSDDGKDDEKPAHTVYLDTYYIDKYEVTNAAYKVCVDAGVCQPPKLTIHSGASDNSVYYGNSKFDNYPVIFMDWFSANAYCEWREASLPTEAQWEKAARGTDERLYPWGDEISCDKANYSVTYRYGCSRDTSEVGSYPRGVSPYGVYDLVGNVSEWVADWYSATYYQISPQSNPQGPDSGQYRVLRGGWWFDYYHEHFVSTSRNKAEPNYSGAYFSRIVGSGYEAIGFRCAKDATP